MAHLPLTGIIYFHVLFTLTITGIIPINWYLCIYIYIVQCEAPSDVCWFIIKPQ